MNTKKKPLVCALSACLVFISSLSFADESDGVIGIPGLNLSQRPIWTISDKTVLFGAENPVGFMMIGGESKITPGTTGADTLVLEQVPNTDGLGFMLSGAASLFINGNLTIEADKPSAGLAVMQNESSMSISGELKIVENSSDFPALGMVIDKSTFTVNHIDFTAAGGETQSGTTGDISEGVKFFKITNGSKIQITKGELKVAPENKGVVIGFDVQDSVLTLENVYLNLTNSSAGVSGVLSKGDDSRVDLGSGDIKISASGVVKAIETTNGQLKKSGGKIELESTASRVEAIKAANAQLSNLEINVKSAVSAKGFELSGESSIENSSLTINSGGGSTGVSIAGEEGKNLLKLNKFSLNIDSSKEEALGLDLSRNTDISESSITVNSSKTAIGLVASKGEISIDSAKVIAKGGEDSYAILGTNDNKSSSGHLTLRGKNSFEAANALGSGRGNSANPLESERDFTLTIESGETVFNGKINEFQGTFNAKGGTTLFSDTTLNGDFNVGNATVVFGDIESNKIESLKAENDLSEPLLYVAKPLYLLKDSNLVVGTLESVTTKTGVTLNKGSTTVINGDIGDNFVFNSEDPNTTFTVDQGALILADNITAGKELRVANFATELVGKESAVVKPVSRLLQLELKKTDDNQLVLVVKPSEGVAEEPTLRNSPTLMPSILNAVAFGAQGEGADRVWELSDIRNGLTDEEFIKRINSIALMGAASGAQSVALTSANYIIDTIESHGSSLNSYRHNNKGVDLWIDLNGSLAKTDKYSAGYTHYGYKSDMSGISLGGDYSFGNGIAAGLSFSFGKGSVRGQNNADGLKNKIEYYGVNGYGVWTTDYANVIGSVGYLLGHNKIRNQGFEGKPKSKTFSLGVRVEKPIAINDTLSITPHLGLRYKHVKLDGFDAGGFKYEVEKADIVETPIGIAASASMTAPCGAKVKPFIDLTVTPNFGDKKVRNKVSLIGSGASDSFDGRIANNALYNAKVGVNATYKSHSLGINYGIGGGSYGRVDQSLQAKYRYEF